MKRSIQSDLFFAKSCMCRDKYSPPPPPCLKYYIRRKKSLEHITFVSLRKLEFRRDTRGKINIAIYWYRNSRCTVWRTLKSRAFRREEKRTKENEKERKRERGGGGRGKTAAKRNSLERNGRGYVVSEGDGGGEGTRAGALTTSRRAHCIPRIPSPFAGRFELGRPTECPKDRILSIVVILRDPTQFRSAPLGSGSLVGFISRKIHLAGVGRLGSVAPWNVPLLNYSTHN